MIDEISGRESSESLSLSTSRTYGEYGFFSILEAPESMIDQDVVDKFRSSFAFDEKERLLGCEWMRFTFTRPTRR